MGKKVAILDLGTNTFLLQISELEDGKFVSTYRDRIASKMGMGGINQGILTEAGISRTIDALKKFKTIIDKHRVDEIFAFGTSAFRSTTNGKAVADQIQQATGIQVKILTGEEEAGYIFDGVREAMDLGEHTSLVVDIGGGSVEFILGNKHRAVCKQSVEIGGQRLLENFQKIDPIDSESVVRLYKFLAKELQPLLLQTSSHPPTVLVGSSGTFDTLSEIYCLRNEIPIIESDTETALTLSGFKEIFEELLIKDRNQRMKIPGMIEMRVDMIVVACCIIQFLIDRHTFTDIRVSGYSLKEGVLQTLNVEH